MYLVPGNWYLVHGSWYLIPGAKYLASATWYQVHCTWYQVLGSRCFNHVPGTRYLVPGAWYLILGTRCLVPGTWCQELGTRYLAPGTWYQVSCTCFQVAKTPALEPKPARPWQRRPSLAPSVPASGRLQALRPRVVELAPACHLSHPQSEPTCMNSLYRGGHSSRLNVW